VNYPVIKIPSLIENARPQEIIIIQEKDIYIKTPNEHGLFLLKTIRNSGYALLFLGTLICCFTLTGNFQWLPLGVILSLLGLIAANWRYIQPELLNPERSSMGLKLRLKKVCQKLIFRNIYNNIFRKFYTLAMNLKLIMITLIQVITRLFFRIRLA
jgi:hypothetical protein